MFHFSALGRKCWAASAWSGFLECLISSGLPLNSVDYFERMAHFQAPPSIDYG